MGIYSYIAVWLAAFLLAHYFTGTWKKPKHSKFILRFHIGKTCYHIHHWMSCSFVVAVILVLVAVDIVSFEVGVVKYLTAFFSGYAVHGFFVADAFKVKNYRRELFMDQWKRKRQKHSRA